jgi:transcriptional regulator with XRE-family HTH domain
MFMTTRLLVMQRHILISGEKLRYHRQRAGLSQEQLAARIREAGGRATPGWLSKLERGATTNVTGVSASNYKHFTDILGIHHDTLRVDLVAA